MNHFSFPQQSLRQGQWFKLICGASYQDLPVVRNLSLVYSLAGADCVDVACDPAVMAAAQEGLQVAQALQEQAQSLGFAPSRSPWLMVSLNDGEDPHFRKAAFDPESCPSDCPRPCEAICPAQAIAFEEPRSSGGSSGVMDYRCYGCGRCVPICPSQLIYTRSYVSTPSQVANLLAAGGINALEIHTQVGHYADFQRLWQAIAPQANRLQLLAVSCPDHLGLMDYLQSLRSILEPLPCPLLWQLDGRPMSGDIGKGTTHAAIKLAQKALAAHLPGYIQLAGGTNGHTVPQLREKQLLFAPKPGDSILAGIIGVGYGSYARSLLSPLWKQWDAIAKDFPSPPIPLSHHLEDYPDLLWQGVKLAQGLVSQLKPTPAQPNKCPSSASC